jgi:hypothetical protein
MLNSDVIYTILRSFPESIALILAGLTLLGIKKDKFYVLKTGIVLAIISYVIRSLPISLGVHTVLYMLIVGGILFNASGEKMINTIIVTCQIWIALALSEVIYLIIAIKIFKIVFEDLAKTTGIYSAIISLPSLLIFSAIILLFSKIQNKMKKKYM